jgi:hypothetical protein
MSPRAIVMPGLFQVGDIQLPKGWPGEIGNPISKGVMVMDD